MEATVLTRNEKIGGIKPYSKNYDDGIEITGKDVIHLNADKITLKVPLDTDAQDVAGAINELFNLDPGGGDGKLKAIVDSGAGLKIVLTDAAAENPTLQEHQYSYSIRTFTQTITTTATDGDTTTTTTQTVNNQSVEKLYDNRGALLLTAHYSDTTIGTIDYYTDRSGMKIWLGEGYLDE